MRHREKVYPLKKAVFYWNTADINRLFCWPGRQKQGWKLFQTVNNKYRWLFSSLGVHRVQTGSGPGAQRGGVKPHFGPPADEPSAPTSRTQLKHFWFFWLRLLKMLVWVFKKWNAPRVWKVQACFCAQGWLFDSSSSRRSRTSVMKQGWPQLLCKDIQCARFYPQTTTNWPAAERERATWRLRVWNWIFNFQSDCGRFYLLVVKVWAGEELLVCENVSL